MTTFAPIFAPAGFTSFARAHSRRDRRSVLHCAAYCGVPAANRAFAIAQQVLEEDANE